MWLECSECGDRIESDARPPICESCGIAGPFFMLVDDPLSDPQPDSLGAAWLLAGMERAQSAIDAPEPTVHGRG